MLYIAAQIASPTASTALLLLTVTYVSAGITTIVLSRRACRALCNVSAAIIIIFAAHAHPGITLILADAFYVLVSWQIVCYAISVLTAPNAQPLTIMADMELVVHHVLTFLLDVHPAPIIALVRPAILAIT